MLIQYQNVEVRQENTPILQNVNFQLNEGEFVYFIGKVGSGKTSLLKTLYAELDVKSGTAEVLGYNMRKLKRKHVPNLRRQLGIVFQDFQLLTDRTVAANLDFVLRATGWKKRKEREQRITEVLQLVSLEHKADSMPHQLSGGEKQRVTIARALLNNPKIILADEPTGNLDTESGQNITALLHDISKNGTAIIMSTHNLTLLQEYPGTVYQTVDSTLIEATDRKSAV